MRILIGMFCLLAAPYLAAGNDGKTTLPDTEYKGTFWRMPEADIDLSRHFDVIEDCRDEYHSDYRNTRSTSGIGKMSNFVTQKGWRDTSESVIVEKGEFLGYISNPAHWGKDPVDTEAVAKKVFSTKLLHFVGWHGPHTKDYLSPLAAGKNVRYIFLAGSKNYPITSSSIKALSKGKKLLGLGITGEGSQDEKVIAAFGKLLNKHKKTLRYLYVENATSAMLPDFSALTNLETLEFRGIENRKWTDEENAAWHSFAGSLTKLQNVHIYCDDAKDDFFKSFPTKGLKQLSLEGDISGEVFKTLDLSSLERLEIESRKLKDLSGLATATNLKRVAVTSSDAAPEVYLPLATMKLEVIALHNAMKVDDTFVEALEGKGLKALVLIGAKLTAKGLKAIDKLTELELLDVWGAPLTDDDLIRWCKALSELHVLNAFKAGKPTDAGIKPWLTHKKLRMCTYNGDGVSKEVRQELIYKNHDRQTAFYNGKD
ncbi:hypothetical protein OAU50_06420 [Planctomycetota bacterium]|nr:hypothetical protein [Planctomycetota bacterium]